jgi:hypothetical protein
LSTVVLQRLVHRLRNKRRANTSAALGAKFAIALVALAAFFAIDIAIAPTAVSVLSSFWAGQLVAFLISGTLGFVILLVGFYAAGPGRLKAALQ